MMKGKNTIILEINRINQLMGIKEVISESRKILISLLQVAEEIVKFAAKKDLDGVTRSTISQLQTGFKNVLDSKGNRIPLEAKDYVKIFDNLSKSSNPGIVAKLAQVERKIVTGIRQNISELVDNSDVKTLIQKYIDQGGTEEFVTKQFADLFKKEYGRYANVGTVADGDGNVLKELIDDYLEGIRKVYVDLGGKLDGVIDDVTTPIIDDTTTTRTTTEPPLPASTNPLVDEVITDSVNSSRLATEELVDDNVARDFQDLNPSAYRQMINSLYSLLERVLVGYGRDGRDVRRQVIYNLERLQRVPSTDEGAILGTEIKREIKADMDMLRNMNRDYLAIVNQTIENGISLTNPNIADRMRWTDIKAKLKTIRDDYGDWGVTAVTSPNSGNFRTFKEAFKALMNIEGKFVNILKNTKNALSNIYEIIAKANGKEVKNVPKPKIPLFDSMIYPGSPRGWPEKLQSYDGKLLPNAYEEILQNSKRFPQFKAYFSLILEKLMLVTKIEFYSAFVVAAVKYIQFTNSEKQRIMKNYGNCVFAIADEMKKGNMNLRSGVKDGAEIPQCLQNLIDSKIDEDTLSKILIRADFFSAGEEGSEYVGFLTREMFEGELKDYIFRFFTGAFANYMWIAWNEFKPAFYESERTGDNNPLETAVEQLESTSVPILDSLDIRIEQARAQANRDSLNISTGSDTTQTNVPISGRTSRNQQRNP